VTDIQEAGRSKGPAGLRPGAHLGRYRLLAPLASGGMAHVWAAKPEGRIGFSRTVALKVVRTEYSEDAEYTRMLIDEATVAGAIHHPNVCELYELDEDKGMLFMVMEWVAGDSLAGLMHRPANAEALPYPFAGVALEPVPYSVAARVVADACAGVHAAHQATDQEGNPLNIVHRDISPPNILVSLEGQVKVSDFGIAKARYQLHARTRTGEVKGKFAYIPPEQIIGKGVTCRADVYALGCVLYVATLGLRPFGSGPSAMPKILQGDYKRPSELLPSYPEGLEKIIVQAVSKKQEERHSTAEELRLALEAWLSESQVVVTPADVARVVRERLDETKRRTIDGLRNTNKPLLYAMAARVERDAGDITQTPTAASGLVARPNSLRPPDPDVSEDPTLLHPVTARTGVAVVAPANLGPKAQPAHSEPGTQTMLLRLRPWWRQNPTGVLLVMVLAGILLMLVLIFLRLSG
jgi:serine/threonine protein kinase